MTLLEMLIEVVLFTRPTRDKRKRLNRTVKAESAKGSLQMGFSFWWIIPMEYTLFWCTANILLREGFFRSDSGQFLLGHSNTWFQIWLTWYCHCTVLRPYEIVQSTQQVWSLQVLASSRRKRLLPEKIPHEDTTMKTPQWRHHNEDTTMKTYTLGT